MFQIKSISLNYFFITKDSLPQSVIDIKKILIKRPHLEVIVLNLNNKITMVILKKTYLNLQMDPRFCVLGGENVLKILKTVDN